LETGCAFDVRIRSTPTATFIALFLVFFLFFV
jgi:hypothetical protein